MRQNQETICTSSVIHQEVVDIVMTKMPKINETLTLTLFFKTISDETRIRIICALNISEMCVCDLTEVLRMTKSAVSHQLRTLREAGIVKNRREGRVVFYSLIDEHVRQIVKTSLIHISEEES